MTHKDPLQVVEVMVEGERVFTLQLPQKTMQGVAQSILILQNIRDRNILTKSERDALKKLMNLLGTVPIWEEK